MRDRRPYGRTASPLRMTQKYILKDDSRSPTGLTIDYKSHLNESQWEVVSEADGPSLVLAGAGSGKTRTLIYRVAYLLEKGARADEILLVTFTNKAALEMRGRVEALLKTKAKGLWCCTFHHIGNRTLRMHGTHIGLPQDFGILDDEDSRDLVKSCIKTLDLGNAGLRFPKPAVVQDILSFSVNAQKSLEQAVLDHAPHLAAFIRPLESIRGLYSEKKRRTSNLDYDDLVLKWIELLKAPGPVHERLTRQFRWCLVDEYQDTNRLQHEVIRLLAGHHGNVLVVCDDAQSIYSFRAAEISNILDFPKTYPGARIFKLETNYRSTRAILELANRSIRHNARQFPKTLKSVHGEGRVPQLVNVRDARQEAAFTAQRLGEVKDAGVELSQIAVLFRARYQAAELELALAKRGVPYVIRGGVRFFEQAHVKDVLAFLRLLANPLDEIAWGRALALQSGIGPAFADKIFALARAAGGDLKKIAAPGFGADLPPRVRTGLASFKRMAAGLLKEERRDRPDALIEEVLENGYNKHVLLRSEKQTSKIQDLRELVNFAHTYKRLQEFLADVTLREGFKGETIVPGAEEETDPDQLVLTTIHQAKGLEWRVVFLIGLAEGQFPHAKSMIKEGELEEERRLFYVAVTRAKEELFMRSEERR